MNVPDDDVTKAIGLLLDFCELLHDSDISMSDLEAGFEREIIDGHFGIQISLFMAHRAMTNLNDRLDATGWFDANEGQQKQ